jgi:polyisoprenyl-teichoic acid--peptidoglycan teichoic acid transferase
VSRRTGLLIVTLVAVLVLGGVAVAAERLLLPDPDGEVLVLLLLGSDGGPPRGDQMLTARADGMQLLFVSGDRQHATFVSLPRDAYVSVAGRGTTRINACLNGGPEPCVATVEQEFGIDVDGYLVTSMDGFKSAIRDFGGITVDIPHPVFDGGQAIPEAGTQRLTGSQALTYGRDRRHRPAGDFTRTQAQAEMLAIGHAEVVEGGDVGRVLETAAILRRHTVTDLSGPQLVRLGFEAMRLPPGNVQRVLAEGTPTMVGGASVVRLHSSAYDVIRDAAADGRIGGG